MTARSQLVTLVVTLVTALPVAGVAQDPGLRAGQWGAEASIGDGQSATLLRFRSPTSAWLLSFGGRVSGATLETSGSLEEENATMWSVDARLGMRSYRASSGAFRPFTTVGALGSYSDGEQGFNDATTWTAGAFLELGGAWFFTPHVSLGASGELNAAYRETKAQSGGFPETDLKLKSWMVEAGRIRLLGAVYF
jgi:hypothetical protein